MGWYPTWSRGQEAQTLCQTLGVCVWSPPCALWHRLTLPPTSGTEGNPGPVMWHSPHLLQGWGRNMLHLFSAMLSICPLPSPRLVADSMLPGWRQVKGQHKPKARRAYEVITSHNGRSAVKHGRLRPWGLLVSWILSTISGRKSVSSQVMLLNIMCSHLIMWLSVDWEQSREWLFFLLLKQDFDKIWEVKKSLLLGFVPVALCGQTTICV